MNLRKKFANWLLKPEIDRLRSLTNEAVNDWRMVPYLQQRDTQALIEHLSEVDPRMMDFLIRQIRDYGYSVDTSDSFRLAVVQECRRLYLNDPVTQFAVELWTDYGFGSTPNLSAEDDNAQAIWDEFFRADRNAPILGERKLHKRSEDMLTDGELFFVVFASTIDGMSTVRTIPTEQIKELIKDPDDSSVVLYYRREFSATDASMTTIYYQDWHATPEQLQRAKLPSDARVADRQADGTDVVVLHAAFREVNGRGWPLATASIDWTNEYKQFLTNRAAVARAAATIVEKIKVKGGQRAIDMIKNRIGSSITGSTDGFENNPPPVAGSTWLENEALDRQWMNRPTNSGDAEKDGMALLTQAGLGYKLYPHYLGRGDTYRLATSTAMEGPTLKSFNRYQSFWASVWLDMFRIVIGFAEKYGNRTFASTVAVVSTDRVIDLSGSDISTAITSLTSLMDRGLISAPAAEAVAEALLKSSLETMGIQGVDEMFQPSNPGQDMEAGESQFPFREDIGDYGVAIRRLFYALWSGKSDAAWFRDNMEYMIDRGLRRAWKEGMESVGLTMDDMSDAEEIELGSAILDQYAYIDGVTDFIIQNSKANGGKLEAIQPRAQMWVNRYKQLSSRAMLMAKNDPPLTWHEGDTEEKCDDCVYADGKTYRASVWKKWGWETQSHELQCGGYMCQCSLDPALPGTKLNKGHPRRPHGKH